MKVNVEKISDNKVKLTIEVSKEEFGVALDKAFEKVSPTVKVDGFRPGHLPKASFIKRFGYEALYEEAVNFALNDTYPKAVMENNVQVVNHPSIDVDFATLNHETGFTYTATVDVMPEVTLGTYKGLEFKPLDKNATPEEVEQEIKNALNAKAENIIKEGAAEKGDTVVIDFEGFIDDVPFEGGKGENYPLELGSNSFIPGFEDQLIGAKEQDEVSVNVRFPEDYHAELAGKDATFKVKVHEVKQKQYPELNDEFVKDLEIENVNNVEEYRNYVQTKLDKEKASQYEEHLVNGLIDLVSNASTVNIPECMVTDYATELKEKAEHQAAQYKIPFNLYLQYMGYTEESFSEYLKKTAEARIKADLVLDKIAEVEDIKVTDEMLENAYKEIAEHNNMELEQVKKSVNPAQLSYKLRQDAVIKLLKDTAVLGATKKKTTKKVAKAENAETAAPKKTTKKVAKAENAETAAPKKATKKVAKAENAETAAPKKATKKVAKAENAETAAPKKATKKVAKAESAETAAPKKTTKKAAKKETE